MPKAIFPSIFAPFAREDERVCIMDDNSSMAGPASHDVENEDAETIDENEQSSALYERYMRLYAEFENYKKRVAREKAEMLEYSCEGLLHSFLPLLDDLDAYLKQSRDDGIVQFTAKLKSVLGEYGLKEIDPIGEKFSPEIAEAIQVRSSGKDDDGRIVEVVQKGYKLKAKVLRYPKVVVGKFTLK